VADILFFQLSSVIESNVACVSRYDGWLGWGVGGCIGWMRRSDATVDVASFPASSE